MGRMSSTTGTGAIHCPFFNAHSADEIRCEGFADAIRYTTMQFESEAEKKRHKVIFCESRYKFCEVYRILMAEKYEQEVKIRGKI